MIKNRFAVAFAFVGLMGLAACGTDDDADVIVEQPVVEEPAPVVTDPAPIVTDTMDMGTDPMYQDTGVVADTAIDM